MIRTVGVFTCLAGLLIAGCIWNRGGRDLGELTAVPISEVAYLCIGEARLTASYYVLSDKTLHFVRLDMPDGEMVTLPSALSASGSRYTDEREYVWWVKGREGFLEKRGDDGGWRLYLEGCREL
ncbi:MliC family protein [Desulfonatronum lacustre]|uniref:MliC family protein n=1 Tax=Desulfonatronum lacustre TaxID=66849 RepID=UPI0004B7EC7D|nr:MliC family protein [Desulfonatronum lacustre]SMP53295.1 Membrane-bound inhibitor of C-type lysozyme [Desulfonatronum zhilinae]